MSIFGLAGDSAMKAYANAAAIQYYERLLPLLSEAEQVEVLLRLGKVQELIGRVERSRTPLPPCLADFG